MNATRILTDLAIIVILLLGISQFRMPRGARVGNLAAAFAMLGAIIAVLYRNNAAGLPWVMAATMVGTLLGGFIAMRVHMIQIPAMVAFQHGAGGVAAMLVSIVELIRVTGEPASALATTSALLGLIIGAATFSGSMIAAGKLANRLRQTPTIFPKHHQTLAGFAVMIALAAGWVGFTPPHFALLVGLPLVVANSIALGVVFSIRIGGADMPVLISFLNATAGLAAAFCGVAIGERLLIACGATVAASGSILTHVMCKAMNRDLANIFSGMRPPDTPPSPASAVVEADTPTVQNYPSDPQAQTLLALRNAQRVIIIPGYGMALADAQTEVVQLAETLIQMGKEVWFAIHPVAGRMPGHMHVLLAEAEADYGRIRELDEMNPLLADTDVALVVGACDVVNPAAIQAANTPISGMPILRAHEAKLVVVCNLDTKPGYSGVENPLYRLANTVLLLGDAKATISAIQSALGESTGVP